jgi:hypothetical protein
MSHFAHVVNGVVDAVIVAEQDFIDTLDDKENWIQTSYNTFRGVHVDPVTREPDNGTPLRGNYAVIGGTYDATNDVFLYPQPFNSWTLNTTTWSWESPIPYPTQESEFGFVWDEKTQNWIEIMPLQ